MAASARSTRPRTTSAAPTSSSTPVRGSSAARSSIPAGTVTQLDLENEILGVRLTKDQIKDSPEFKPDTDEYRSEEYRSELGTYYGQYRS